MIKRPIELSHDFLSHLAKKVYAFDVQEQALIKTREKLGNLGFNNVQLILDGHQTIDKYVDGPIRAAIFNLGYLPSADKTIITKPDTTLEAIGKILDRLEVGGRISIMIYYGHEGGDKEKDAVLNFVKELDQQHFTVMLYQPLNQINTPPFLVMIEKL
ncbi:tRNA (mnm(5)s(2)U34)-methyltransferase [Streptococcus mutans]|uniref:tRNA (mnm(5)s(2)U34)-methyltransferase n=1 Tax=Streptococcus mutans TaxID=1309 RepID=UPI0002B52015|nr:class I SAM-dependent methyltransferase [Streptococcus mutans]EMC18064.1 hypothetical protein SMU77_04250 [Streptococcus mutans NV1996]